MSVKGFKLSNGNVVKYDYSSLDNIVTDNTLSVTGTAADAGAVGTEFVGVRNDLVDLSDKIDLTNQVLADKVDGAYADDDGYLYLTSNGEVVVGPIGPFAGGGSGGGGGGGNNAQITVANTTGWLSTTISESEPCNISFNWSSVEDDFPTGDGSVAVRVNGVVKEQRTIQQGEVTINVRDYLSSGSNIVRFTVSDVYGNNRTLSFTVSVVALSISATSFEQSNANATYSGSVNFTYTPVGAVTKTVTFKLDNSVIGTQEVTTSGRQQSFTIPNQSHGAHNLEVYFTAEVNGVTVESNHLYFSLIFVESGNTTPIIASSFNATGATQYYTLSIPYTVYTPNAASSTVSFTAQTVDSDGHSTTIDLGTRVVNRTQQTFTYTPNTEGTLTLTITTGSVSKSFTLTVAKLNIDVEAETDSLELYLSASGRSNGETNPASWTYNNISCVFNDFNFISDGWTLDEDNSTCLKVTGDARLIIPFKIFENDFRPTGKTIEFDFSTTNVRNYDTPVVSCYSGGKGLVITPQSVTLTGSNNTIATTQYKEDEHVRITFVIEKISEYRLIYTYINGICSGIIQYAQLTDFQQETPVNITVGSSDCTINLYTVRVYNNSLPRHQVLNNWIADTPDGATMLARYNHNNVYDEYGDIVINKLPSDLPYLIVESATLPQYKGDKKTISGSYTNPINESLSFEFTDASMDVQGTSSAGYPRKNYKIKFKNFTDNNGNTSSTYCLRGASQSIPSKVFCFKADYASSEGANNVELVRLYNDSCPYKTPPQEDDEMVRQGIDGIPILIFWSNTNNGTTTFLGKYNFNFDKSSPVFGFDDGDESWETLDNSNDWALFKRADFEGTGWLNAFEARFPDLDDPYTDSTNLAVMAKWVNSTDRDAATNTALSSSVTYEGVTYTTDSSDYRLAKFRNELTNYFNKDDVLFYYLFTELFLMIDSRVKNSFPTLYASHDGAKWCWLPYDMDSAIGINNEGKLAFDYNLEDIDAPSKLPTIYNGRETVMWNNVRDAFPNELRSMYQSLRAEGIISYEEVESRFETHQHTWSEAIFNEDAYFKYVKPFIEDGEDNLAMCLGSKEQQRKWWLYNRFRYIDSKYNSGHALSSYIQARVYQKSDLDVTPYADIYASAYFDSNLVQARAERNVVTTVESPDGWNPGGADAVLRIYSADQIKSLGDLSQFYVGDVSFASAVKLQNIKLGDASADYSNEHLVNVGFGNNTLLQSVDIRNCPNLTQTVELSGCTGLEVAHFEGTNIAGITLPDASSIRELYLPASITNLTLKNQSKLETLEIADMSNIESLWVEGHMSDEAIDMIDDIATSNRRLRIVGFNKTFESDDDFNSLWNLIKNSGGLDDTGMNTSYAYLDGTFTVNELRHGIYDSLTNYPFLTINYTTLGDYAYKMYLENNSKLTEYSDSLITKFRDYAFYKSRVTSINCPNVVEIGNNLTTGATSISSFVVGKLQYIGQNAFTTQIPTSELDNIDLSELTTIEQNAFNASSFSELRLPSLTTINSNSFSSFYNMKKLTLLDIPYYPNNWNTALCNLCSNLTTFIIRSGQMVVFANNNAIFGSTPIRQAGNYSTVGQGYIYVPSSLVDSYKADWTAKTNLASLVDYIRAIEDYPEICDPNYQGGE